MVRNSQKTQTQSEMLIKMADLPFNKRINRRAKNLQGCPTAFRLYCCCQLVLSLHLDIIAVQLGFRIINIDLQRFNSIRFDSLHRSVAAPVSDWDCCYLPSPLLPFSIAHKRTRIHKATPTLSCALLLQMLLLLPPRQLIADNGKFSHIDYLAPF